MSDSFDALIREIRELMEPRLELNRWEDLNPEYVLALVDIAAAARLVREDIPAHSVPRAYLAELDEAIARFESL